jgi:hypothetical protein
MRFDHWRESARVLRSGIVSFMLLAGATACDRGGAFEPLAFDGTYRTAIGHSVFVRSLPSGSQNIETWLVDGSITFRSDGTGEMTSRVERRAVSDTTQKVVTIPFTYRFDDERIVARPRGCGGPICTASISYFYFELRGTTLYSLEGTNRIPYERSE